jgi:ArsR family transcriptional regulator, arsenate/arsenite/antimonite-responsive transcriptional repressor
VRDAAQFFKLLADESRLRILWLLFHRSELCVCDIMAALGISQSKASRHLAALRHAELVTDRKQGLWSYYSLCTPRDALVRQHLELLRVTLGKHTESRALLTKLERCLEKQVRCAPSSSG